MSDWSPDHMKRLLEPICQTLGCGHAKDHHFTQRLGGRCSRHECPCLCFTAPTETVSEPDLCGQCKHHMAYHRTADKASCVMCTSILTPTREQVVADAEAAYRSEYDTCDADDAEHRTMHRAFIAGYLAAKGIDQ